MVKLAATVGFNVRVRATSALDLDDITAADEAQVRNKALEHGKKVLKLAKRMRTGWIAAFGDVELELAAVPETDVMVQVDTDTGDAKATENAKGGKGAKASAAQEPAVQEPTAGKDGADTGRLALPIGPINLKAGQPSTRDAVDLVLRIADVPLVIPQRGPDGYIESDAAMFAGGLGIAVMIDAKRMCGDHDFSKGLSTNQVVCLLKALAGGAIPGDQHREADTPEEMAAAYVEVVRSARKMLTAAGVAIREAAPDTEPAPMPASATELATGRLL